MTTSASKPTRWPRIVAATSLALWGLLHLAGGVSLTSMTATEGLETLGPDAGAPVPEDAGESAAALLHFHGLNVAVAGLAVLVLAIAWSRSRRTWQVVVAIGIAVVLDVGLLLYLVIPGLLPASQGLLGPGLLILGSAGAVLAVSRTTPIHIPVLTAKATP